MTTTAWLWVWASAAAVETGDYRIGTGDVIEVVVHGERLGQGGFVVAGNGLVSLPCAGLVPFSGRTAYEAEDETRKALTPDCYVDPQVTVRITEHRSKPVEVMGAVSKPGVYYLDGQSTLRSVISRAGGVKSERSSGHIQVVRRGEEPMQVALDELDATLGDYVLVSGDVVRVDEGRIVYVSGEVKKPGEIPFADGLTVADALIKAGDSTALGRLSGAYVLRDEDRIPVNLRRILRGKSPDLVLEAGDRLVIPEKAL